ncbi:ABC transporter ATP-binding protein [bacterium]|nr:ABC transporter ATP-binding protein [bacterium]
MIEITGLQKLFDDRIVLRDVNLTIPEGRSIVIVGRSGYGKSVLLKSIIGLVRPDRGTITVDGVTITGLGRKQLFSIRKKMGMLFQSAALFDSMSVYDNVALPLREHTAYGAKEIERRVLEKLSLVGLATAAAQPPSELSGGMKKRVGLARALIMEPKVMLYDEPTTGLDPITAGEINLLIRETQSRLRITSVIVTHELDSAYVTADSIAMLHDGVISFHGSVDAFRGTSDPVVTGFRDGLRRGEGGLS